MNDTVAQSTQQQHNPTNEDEQDVAWSSLLTCDNTCSANDDSSASNGLAQPDQNNKIESPAIGISDNPLTKSDNKSSNQLPHGDKEGEINISTEREQNNAVLSKVAVITTATTALEEGGPSDTESSSSSSDKSSPENHKSSDLSKGGKRYLTPRSIVRRLRHPATIKKKSLESKTSQNRVLEDEFVIDDTHKTPPLHDEKENIEQDYNDSPTPRPQLMCLSSGLISTSMAILLALMGLASNIVSRSSTKFVKLQRDLLFKDDTYIPVHYLGLFHIQLCDLILDDDETLSRGRAPYKVISPTLFDVSESSSSSINATYVGDCSIHRLTKSDVYDTLWNGSRISSTLSIVLGGTTLIMLLLATFRPTHLRLLSLLALLTYIGQTCVFFLFGSNMCVQRGCAMSIGSYWALTSSVMWFFCAIATFQMYLTKFDMRKEIHRQQQEVHEKQMSGDRPGDGGGDNMPPPRYWDGPSLLDALSGSSYSTIDLLDGSEYDPEDDVACAASSSPRSIVDLFANSGYCSHLPSHVCGGATTTRATNPECLNFTNTIEQRRTKNPYKWNTYDEDEDDNDDDDEDDILLNIEDPNSTSSSPSRAKEARSSSCITNYSTETKRISNRRTNGPQPESSTFSGRHYPHRGNIILQPCESMGELSEC